MNAFSVAIVGCGEFARNFVPLFKAHPYVSKVFVCDLIRERAEEYSRLFGVEIISDYDEVLKRRDVDAVACFADRHLHGPIVIRALNAGKHVYSAVPMAGMPEECEEICSLVRKTGLTYMMGETCIYYPCSMFCRREYAAGRFGRFVYAESQYYHDLSHFPANFLANRQTSAVPPFLYPTHSTAMPLYALGERITHVTAYGYRDEEENTPFRKGENLWDNELSDEFSLMRLSGGGVLRINECRRIGFKAPSSSIQSFYGTKAGYQFSNAQHLVTSLTPAGVSLEDVSDIVNPRDMTLHKSDADFKERVANHAWQGNSPAPIQDATIAFRSHLPDEYWKIPSGHMNSHRFLVDDFAIAVLTRKLPPVNAWTAARFTVPGLIAHRSAERGGENLPVPDFGDAPETPFAVE